MKTIKMTNGLILPEVAIGCMRFADRDRNHLAELMHCCIDLGANHFDLADIYGDYRCEELFGEVLRSDSAFKREDIIVQTKCGIRKDPYRYDLSPDYIHSSIDGSLQRLSCGYIDIFTLHRPDVLTAWPSLAEALLDECNRGRIRHIAVSNFTVSQIQALSKFLEKPICAAQMQLSLAHAPLISSCFEANLYGTNGIESSSGFLDYCTSNEVVLQAWSPLQMSGWRGTFIGNGEYGELNGVLWRLSQKYACTPAAIAAAWILRIAGQTQVVSGTTSVEHIRDFIRAADITLEHSEWYELYAAAKHHLP